MEPAQPAAIFAGRRVIVLLVLGVGFLAGFTTFSTFAVQAFLDVEAGEPIRALLLVRATLLLGLAAAAVGFYAGRAVL
jgi:CrcB protein